MPIEETEYEEITQAVLREPEELYSLPEKLNIYIDESDNLDNRTANSRYYIISLVFHEGDEEDLAGEEEKLEEAFARPGYPGHCFHTGPIIHHNEQYETECPEIRRKMLFYFFSFFRHINITHREFVIEKKNLNKKDIQNRLTKEIKTFLKENSLYFGSFREVNINYDNGQAIVSNVLTDSFREALARPNFVKMKPEESRLMQIADLISTLKLLEMKIERMSNTENDFFDGQRKFKRIYLSPVESKEFQQLNHK